MESYIILILHFKIPTKIKKVRNDKYTKPTFFPTAKGKAMKRTAANQQKTWRMREEDCPHERTEFGGSGLKSRWVEPASCRSSTCMVMSSTSCGSPLMCSYQYR